MNSRNLKLTSHLNLKEEIGLEIGPLCWPVVSRSEGGVFYADRLSANELKGKYADDPDVPCDQIVEVDYVLGNRSLAEDVGTSRKFDYIIHSHVIEHVPDPISFLSELCSLLRAGGTICMAIPDKRFTFDYYRPPTEFGEILESFLLKRRSPSPKQVFSHFSLEAQVAPALAWQQSESPYEPRRVRSITEALSLSKEAALGKYLDCHCSVFTPASFCEFLRNCMDLGLLDLEVLRFFDTVPPENEFFVVLKRLNPAYDETTKKQIQLASLPESKQSPLIREERALSTGGGDWILIGSKTGGFEGRIFVIRRGKRYWVPTMEWAINAGFRWPDDIIWLGDDEIALYPLALGECPVLR